MDQTDCFGQPVFIYRESGAGIETVRGAGYRFNPEVLQNREEPEMDADKPEWDDKP